MRTKIKTIYRIIASITAIIILVVQLGCSNGSADNTDQPEPNPKPEIITFPKLDDDMRRINNIILHDDIIYFTSRVIKTIEINGVQETRTGIDYVFSISINDTEMISSLSFTPLPDFIPPQPPLDALTGWHLVNAMQSDCDGNIWTVESGGHIMFDFPEDFDIDQADEEAIWEYYKVVDSYNIVRKLDKTGVELLSLDIDAIVGNRNMMFVRFNVDAGSNLYLGFDDIVSVIDRNGQLLFELSIPSGHADRLLRMPNGNIAHPEMTGTGMMLLEIDVTNRAWMQSIQLPPDASMPFPGNIEFPVIYADRNNLVAYNPDTGETVNILNWIDVGIMPESIVYLSVLKDGQIMLTSDMSRAVLEQDIKFMFMPLSEYETPFDDRIPLTLATIYLDAYIRDAIMAFNRTSDMHYIQLKDYSEYNTEHDSSIALTRLTIDLVTGNIPDMLDVSRLPLPRYVAMGLLENLYPFLDADPELGREDLLEGVLNATEINGAIYKLFPAFFISTIYGNPSLVGSYPGWDIDEFTAALKANPQADNPVGLLTRMDFLQSFLYYSMNDFIDWENGTVNFDSDEFIQLLHMVEMLPIDNSDDWDFSNYFEMITTGRQIMDPGPLGHIYTYMIYKTLFGGDIVFKGYPTLNRNGHFINSQGGIAITTTSNNKEASWEFIRSFLKADFAREYIDYPFPINKTVFNEILDKAMTDVIDARISHGGLVVDIVLLTQQDVDKITDLINRSTDVSNLMPDLYNIVVEGASDYFTGRVTVHEAVRVIQNRASRYMSESAS